MLQRWKAGGLPMYLTPQDANCTHIQFKPNWRADPNIMSHLRTLHLKCFIFTVISKKTIISSFPFLSQITKLKIDSNPFAKGFRDSARITQIDRESVDLLIKASRHGYSHLQTSVPNPHGLINIPSAQSQISLFQHGKCYTANVIQINTVINDKQVTYNA